MIKNILRKYLAKRNRNNYEMHIISNNKFGFELTKEEKDFCKKTGFTYSEYGVYRANSDDISKYITSLDSYLPRENGNNGDLIIVSDNKLLFPYVFGNYFKVAQNYALIIQGNIVPLNDSGLNKDTIFDFVKRFDLIAKPYSGSDGKGIYKFSYNSIEDSFCVNDKLKTKEDILQEILKLNKYIIQDKLVQHPFFSELYPNSLNTLRIISARTNECYEHEILCAVQRIGSDKSAPADNFSKDGFSAKINVDTGELSKATGPKTIDNNGRRLFYSKHPNTGGQIEGRIIPYWDEIKQKIKDFTRKFPMYNYIAWDLCVNDKDEVMVIETNMKSSLGVFQAHGGMKGTKLDQVLQSYKKQK